MGFYKKTVISFSTARGIRCFFFFFFFQKRRKIIKKKKVQIDTERFVADASSTVCEIGTIVCGVPTKYGYTTDEMHNVACPSDFIEETKASKEARNRSLSCVSLSLQ
jgi:hypothetical protein